MRHKNFEFGDKKVYNIMEVLSKSMIEKWIVPYLSVGKRGAKPQVMLHDVVALILHRLKSGDQWRMIPVQQYFQSGAISWNGVYYYFNKWFKVGSFQKARIAILQRNKTLLDLSSLQLDGSQTIAKAGGEAVGYQVERKRTQPMRFFLETKRDNH